MAALRSIVTDPALGSEVLSDPPMMANVLEDLLPGANREIQVLVAAASSGVAGVLRSRVAEGMITAVAVRLAISRFAAESAFSQDVCDWAVRQYARALGLDIPDGEAQAEAQAQVLAGREPPTNLADARDDLGALFAEVIMLRARCSELAEDLRFRNLQSCTTEATVAESLAEDIKRTQNEAKGTDLGLQLEGAERLAASLLRALLAGGKYRSGLLKNKHVSALEAAEALRAAIYQFPMDISGCDVTMIDLLEPHKIGVSYAEDERLAAFHGVIWSERTIWPAGYREIMVKCSRPLRRGI